jgi:hypothetical protein
VNAAAIIRDALLQPAKTGQTESVSTLLTNPARVMEWPAPLGLPDGSGFVVFKITGGDPEYFFTDEDLQVEMWSYGPQNDPTLAKRLSAAIKDTIHGRGAYSVENEDTRLAHGTMNFAIAERPGVLLRDPDTQWYFVHDIYHMRTRDN